MHRLMTIAYLGAALAATLAAVLAASPAAARPLHAQSTVERGWPLDMDGDIRVHNYSGSVTLIGWDRDSVAVTAVVLPGHAFFGGGSRRGIKLGVESSDPRNASPASVTIRAPSRARVEIRGAATTIDVRDFAGSIDASTLGGAVTIAGPAAEVTVETMDGAVTVAASPRYLRVRTAGGRVAWQGASDEFAITTVGGDVRVADATVRNGRVESILGAIEFAGAVKPDGRLTFDTHAGDIRVALTAGSRADVTVDAQKAALLGRPYVRAGGAPPTVTRIPAGGKAGAGASILTRTYKGTVVVTQP